MSAVHRSISDGIFHHQLEGFEKYPRGRDGRFLEVFNEQCVSVDHARAVALSFRERMPTLQEIVDTALNLRPRFEALPSQREQWEKEFGPPRPFDTSVLRSVGQGSNREIDRLWKQVLAFFRTNNFDGRGDIQRVSIGRCWQVAKALGYSMNSYQQREIDDYEHTYPESKQKLPTRAAAQSFTPITQADVDRVVAEREPGDGE
jgi:hypothetical protein